MKAPKKYSLGQAEPFTLSLSLSYPKPCFLFLPRPHPPFSSPFPLRLLSSSSPPRPPLLLHHHHYASEGGDDGCRQPRLLGALLIPLPKELELLLLLLLHLLRRRRAAAAMARRRNCRDGRSCGGPPSCPSTPSPSSLSRWAALQLIFILVFSSLADTVCCYLHQFLSSLGSI
ncbi:2-carboxy-1,4-naphthoquinone phytyltransferase, chloroplastic [Iris pallida]|uniref:2-carboxy-1,4-naphthoquinone phytyltransferase, chloroplastic n=1 Tax=Iris pallida TaxID=29817 RepID=A0AAX6DGG0_IRIPA|nr:2-carboxy-1,4-naphthoquinone phytyltransferase, chloroplastic [Iris pallida]